MYFKKGIICHTDASFGLYSFATNFCAEHATGLAGTVQTKEPKAAAEIKINPGDINEFQNR